MQIRRFSPDLKTKVPGGHPGLYAVPIQIQNTGFSPERLEALARHANGLPFLLKSELTVVAMYLEPHGSIDEHQADHPILFLVISGQGTVRIGGPEGETRVVQAGDAVLWPAFVDHTAWTDAEPMHAIAIEAPPELSQENYTDTIVSP
jgi:quercetin dioxygenase-like cupin family protein